MKLISNSGKYTAACRSRHLLPWILLLVLFGAVFLGSAAMMLHHCLGLRRDRLQLEELAALVEVPAEPAPALPPPEPDAPPRPPQILPRFEALARQNPDLFGWVSIDGTTINYPVMHTPSDPEKYLRLDFYGSYSYTGTPFLDAGCTADSDQLLIYGHNMNSGLLFHDLLLYEDRAYWEAHPVIRFSTLYEEREYEILSVFYDRVRSQSEDGFRFYYYTDGTEADFREAMDYYRSQALYDTGVTAEYGDQLLVLTTCSYHTEDGRFAVVARRTDPGSP